jgi:HK97 family phage major capsid protein
MKELNYNNSNANKLKIGFAKRKQTMSRIVIGIVFLFCAIGFAGADFSKSQNAETVIGQVLTIATVIPAFMVDGKFKELKGEELKTFIETAEPEQLAEYYNKKNEAGIAELKTLLEKKEKESTEALENQIKELKESLAEERKEQMTALNQALKQYGLAIEKLNKENQSNSLMAQATDIRKALEENKANLAALKDVDKSKAGTAGFSFKTVGTMLESTNISGGNVPVEQRIPGLNVIATRKVRLMDLFAKGSATSNIISWVYQANKEGGAGGTSEGDTKNQADFDLVVASQAVVKRTVFIKVSTEMLDDIDFIESEIRNELMRLLLLDVEDTAYSGNGTAPALNGVRTVATAFAAGTFAGTVDNANSVDVLTVAANQIALANQEAPNAILMNPSDVTAFKLLKVSSTDRRYVERLIYIAGNMTLDGIPIIETTLVTAGTYMIGNFNLSTLYQMQGIMINIGLDGNDWTKNLRTIIAEWRGALVVKNNNRTAFVKGTFATDIAALETA